MCVHVCVHRKYINWSYPTHGFIPEARSHRLPNKRSLLPSVCYLPLKVLIEVAWRFYPKIADIVINLGCPSEIDGKILLLKYQRLDTGYGKITRWCYEVFWGAVTNSHTYLQSL